MKKKILGMLMLMAIAAVLTAGCGSGESNTGDSAATNDTAAATEEFTFEASGTKIQMNEKTDSILEALGEEKSYFEAESCAFKGLDKTYTYSGFRLYTYPVDDVDYVYTVELMDDSVETKEGVAIGDSVDEVTKAYGEDYEGEDSSRTYTKGNSQLRFIFDGETVKSIEYLAVTD